ncbi:MAG: tetratricopeptide repeat protein [Bacteroidia bacterium]
MHKIWGIIFALGFVWAQKSNKKRTSPTPSKASEARELYNLASRYQDGLMQIQALYHLILHEPDKATAWKDTLTQVYFSLQMYPQAIAVADELLAQTPKTQHLQRIRALAYLLQRDNKKALEEYEKLYELSGDPQDLYQIITLQYNLQRFGECSANIERLLSMPQAETQAIDLTLPNGTSESVPLKAATYNVKGVLLRMQKEYTKAEEAFQKALEIKPDFLLAKGNLEDLRREIQNTQNPTPDKK